MDYFQLLDLKKEPFSNSPDPEFFYGSRQHQGCLQKLELSVRLRRGLNVVVADVGMGKTTLCRQLIRRFASDPDVRTHLLLDPACSNAHEFLCIIAQLFGLPGDPEKDTERQLKERIKDFLFSQGVEKGKVIALIIDEGQKLPFHCVEVLREFLNYETNASKLLQIVIFAQTEFDEVLRQHNNFADRVSLYQTLTPLSFGETKALVRFRLREAAEGVVPAIFSESGFWAVYLATGGYPRKIVELGYKVLLALILQNKKRATWRLVRSCAKRGVPVQRPVSRLSPVLMMALLVIMIVVGLSASSLDGISGVWEKFQPHQDIQTSAVAPITLPVHKQPEAVLVKEDEPVDPPQVVLEIVPEIPAAVEEPTPVSVDPDNRVIPEGESEGLNAPKDVLVKVFSKSVDASSTASLTNMWGGRFPNYSQIIFWFDHEVKLEGPVVNSREAEFRFVSTSSQVAPYREYSSFPGWVALKDQEGYLQARIGLPNNLEGMEHYIERDPFRVVVNLYHYQQPGIKDNS
ncbi:MAG: AAA family ATPase [Desulfatibacillum sp.]|nr:AAA family ATPase [Desulfatibacillum sp.]